MRAIRMLLAAALVVGLAGCASCPPIRAAWYRVDNGAEARATLMMAIVSEGAQAVELRSLTVNPGAGDRSGGWSPRRTATLQPGQVLVFDLMSFVDAEGRPFPRCRLPVAVAYRCGAQDEPSRATIEGRMPNYLPEDWVKDCAP